MTLLRKTLENGVKVTLFEYGICSENRVKVTLHPPQNRVKVTQNRVKVTL